MTTEFNLDGFDSPVPVTIHPGASSRTLTKEHVLGFKGFADWKAQLGNSLRIQHTDKEHTFYGKPASLKSVEIQSVDWFGPNVGFMKTKPVIVSDDGREIPGICFLRGGSVAVLIILRPRDAREERMVVMTEQPRVPAGSLSFMEIPAGMLDTSDNFAGKAAKEIEEEVGLKIPHSELLDLTQLALSKATRNPEGLLDAMYPSPGGSDEFITIYLWEKELDRQEIEDLRGKLTGIKTQGEMITLRLIEYEALWRECARDAKTLAAWALYEGLNRDGTLKRSLKRQLTGLSSDGTTEEMPTARGRRRFQK
ncbi:uncharacterized protein PG986_011844 [Apiospora aurea]|uniref:Nudix hydrolase domain-containing protein n=1 Tax=Apiospora aurea TaxID=335848 RepID=A0ABR1PYC4_9PEZI